MKSFAGSQPDCAQVTKDMAATFEKINANQFSVDCAAFKLFIDEASSPTSRATCAEEFPDGRYVEYLNRDYLERCEGQSQDQLPAMPPAL